MAPFECSTIVFLFDVSTVADVVEFDDVVEDEDDVRIISFSFDIFGQKIITLPNIFEL